MNNHQLKEVTSRPEINHAIELILAPQQQHCTINTKKPNGTKSVIYI